MEYPPRFTASLGEIIEVGIHGGLLRSALVLGDFYDYLIQYSAANDSINHQCPE